MTKDKLSYKISKIIKSAIATAALPIFIIYIMVAKPDYAIMNGMAHIVLPVANAVGAVITWPIRVVGHSADWIRETANLRSENEKLRLLLDEAQSNKNACDIAIAENKKLEHELNVKKTSPFDAVVANIQFEDSAFYHSTFLIDKGRKNGLEKGMVVVSFENRLVGTILDCGSEFCRVRSLSDSDTNIAVRIAGTDISGFLKGNGKNKSFIGFFNDAKFESQKGLKVISSNISGILPSGIYIGTTLNNGRVDILTPNKISRVMVLKYTNQGSYK